MNIEAQHRPSRRARALKPMALAALAAATLVLGACIPPSSGGGGTTTTSTTAAPTGPRVTVSKTTGLGASQTLTITGAGFNPNSNNGFGIYVSFGRLAALGSTNAADLPATKWVHKNGPTPATTGQAKLNADGTFSITLTVTKTFTDTTGSVTCSTQCGIITMSAHGVPDRSQDTSTALRFN